MTRLLACAVMVAAVAVGQAPAKTGSVEGRVTSSTTGAPLRRASVTLEMFQSFSSLDEIDPAEFTDPQKIMARMAQQRSYKTETDAEGKFALRGVEAGQYTMNASRSGYVSGSESVDLRKAEDRKDIEIKLTPQAVISGKILDEFGDPLAQASVTVFRRGYSTGHWKYEQAAMGSTGADGAYSIGGLRAGRYYVSAMDAQSTALSMMGGFLGQATPEGPRTEYVPTYYPSGTEIARAAPVTLLLGAEARGIDIRMQKSPVFQVRGRVVAPEGSTSNVMLTMTRNGDDKISASDFMRGMAMVGADGTFRFTAIAPGAYSIRMDAGMGAVFGNAFAAAMTVSAGGAAAATPAPKAPSAPLVGQQAVVVVDRDLNEVSLMAGSAGDISGRWRVEESKAPKSLETPAATNQAVPSLFLEPIDFMSAPPKPAKGKADGTFELKGVAPGEYLVSLGVPPPGSYVRSVRFDGQEATNKIIRVGLGGGQLEIVYARDGGTVKGVVRNEKGEPVKGVTVAMWDARLKAGEAAPYYEEQTISSEGEEFRFDGVPPGEYRLAAWPGIAGITMPTGDSNMAAPEVLMQFSGQATAVKVGSDSEMTVEVKLVGKDAIEKALEKLP